jgi:hypothetical protein
MHYDKKLFLFFVNSILISCYASHEENLSLAMSSCIPFDSSIASANKSNHSTIIKTPEGISINIDGEDDSELQQPKSRSTSPTTRASKFHISPPFDLSKVKKEMTELKKEQKEEILKLDTRIDTTLHLMEQDYNTKMSSFEYRIQTIENKINMQETNLQNSGTELLDTIELDEIKIKNKNSSDSAIFYQGIIHSIKNITNAINGLQDWKTLVSNTQKEQLLNQEKWPIKIQFYLQTIGAYFAFLFGIYLLGSWIGVGELLPFKK